MLQIALFLFLSRLVFCIDVQKPYYDIEKASDYFNNFIVTYKKQYSSDEREKRLSIFTENLKKFNKLNKGDGAIYGINKFADLTAEEFKSTYLGFVPSRRNSICTVVKDADVTTNTAPGTFDWRDMNVVTPVKDQKSCGSCYAFSSVGNIESIYAVKNGGVKLDLSEQQLLDCSKTNLGCYGGIMDECMMDIMRVGGIEDESDYPYRAKDEKCTFNRSLAKVKLSGCTNYRLQEVKKVKEVLFTVGPLSIAMDGFSVLGYNSGVLRMCTDMISHAVLLVGYGTENGVDYWIIKNSWGEDWGENGYFRVTRNITDCPILNIYTFSAILA